MIWNHFSTFLYNLWGFRSLISKTVLYSAYHLLSWMCLAAVLILQIPQSSFLFFIDIGIRFYLLWQKNQTWWNHYLWKRSSFKLFYIVQSLSLLHLFSSLGQFLLHLVSSPLAFLSLHTSHCCLSWSGNLPKTFQRLSVGWILVFVPT